MFASGMAVAGGLSALAQQPAPSLSLSDAVHIALGRHPAIVKATHTAAAAAARIREAQAGNMPTLELQAAATTGPTGAPAFGPPGLQGIVGDPLKSHYAAALNILWPLYDFGRTQHLVAARQELLRAATEDTDTERSVVALGVQEAYLAVLHRQQLLQALRADVTRRKVTLAQAKLYVEGGLRADVDLRLAEANLAEARLALLNGENDVRLGFAQLNNAMGDTRLQEYTLTALPESAPLAGTSEALMQEAVAQRPELKGATAQVRAAGQSVEAARSELMPRVDTVASVGALKPNSLTLENKNYAVGLAVTFPFYTGGLAEGRIVEEKERQAAAQASQRELEEAVKLQAARAWLGVKNRESQLTAAQAQEVSARSSADQASERYRLQLATLEELLAAQAAAVRAETQLVNARFDLQLARAELDWATGSLLPPAPRKGK
jgi:outer membrane protein